jgi:hypothetical protein
MLATQKLLSVVLCASATELNFATMSNGTRFPVLKPGSCSCGIRRHKCDSVVLFIADLE